MAFDIRGKVALVTGANRGIGRVIVEKLVATGASKVYAAVRNVESASDLREQFGDRVVLLHLDLADPKSIESAAELAQDVQLVVNNAGVLRNAGPLADDAIEHLQYEIDINVFGLLRIARAFAPVLAKHDSSALVQLNSVASLKNFSDFATYSASKAAAYSLTQALRDHMGRKGIQVVSVHPGPIATDMAHNAGLTDIAEPPAIVAETIVEALASGEFHAFPDTMARSFWQAYEGFARNVVEPVMQEETPAH